MKLLLDVPKLPSPTAVANLDLVRREKLLR
jgi:hypothetical protein